MLNFTQIKKEIEEKGTEEMKYKLYNSGIINEDLYKMYNNAMEMIQREVQTPKKRAKICSMIVDNIYKYIIYYKIQDNKIQLEKIHEDILKRDTYLKAKGLDNFNTLVKREVKNDINSF